MYSVKWTFMHKRNPRQNDEFILLSANKDSVWHV